MSHLQCLGHLKQLPWSPLLDVADFTDQIRKASLLAENNLSESIETRRFLGGHRLVNTWEAGEMSWSFTVFYDWSVQFYQKHRYRKHISTVRYWLKVREAADFGGCQTLRPCPPCIRKASHHCPDHPIPSKNCSNWSKWGKGPRDWRWPNPQNLPSLHSESFTPPPWNQMPSKNRSVLEVRTGTLDDRGSGFGDSQSLKTLSSLPSQSFTPFDHPIPSKNLSELPSHNWNKWGKGFRLWPSPKPQGPALLEHAHHLDSAALSSWWLTVTTNVAVHRSMSCWCPNWKVTGIDPKSMAFPVPLICFRCFVMLVFGKTMDVHMFFLLFLRLPKLEIDFTVACLLPHEWCPTGSLWPGPPRCERSAEKWPTPCRSKKRSSKMWKISPNVHPLRIQGYPKKWISSTILFYRDGIKNHQSLYSMRSVCGSLRDARWSEKPGETLSIPWASWRSPNIHLSRITSWKSLPFGNWKYPLEFGVLGCWGALKRWWEIHLNLFFLGRRVEEGTPNVPENFSIDSSGSHLWVKNIIYVTPTQKIQGFRPLTKVD